MKHLILPCCELTFKDNGIIICTPHEGYNISGDDALAIIDAAQQLSLQDSAPVLVDHTIPHSLSHEAMKILSSTHYPSGVAFLFMTPLNRLAIDYFIKSGQPDYPIKAFSDRQQAESWLTAFAA